MTDRLGDFISGINQVLDDWEQVKAQHHIGYEWIVAGNELLDQLRSK